MSDLSEVIEQAIRGVLGLLKVTTAIAPQGRGVSAEDAAKQLTDAALSAVASLLEGKAAELAESERRLAEAQLDVLERGKEIDRLRSWSGLMSMLDEHYPASIFVGDGETADPGARIVALVREVDRLRREVEFEANAERYDHNGDTLRCQDPRCPDRFVGLTRFKDQEAHVATEHGDLLAEDYEERHRDCATAGGVCIHHASSSVLPDGGPQ